jgi:hypothetical protein
MSCKILGSLGAHREGQCSVGFVGPLRAFSVHSLQNLTANPLCRDLCREGRSNAIPSQIHCILLAATCYIFFVLVQKLPYLMGQSSTTCTLVAILILYLESHLLCALIAAVKGVLELTRSHWNIQREGLFLQIIAYWGVVFYVGWGANNLLFAGSHCKISLQWDMQYGLRML